MQPLPDATASPASNLKVRVYYEDTDAAGVVYYANYLRFCERARTEWLRGIGYEQQQLMRDCHIGFVVKNVNADYRAPARLDDMLDVITRIAVPKRASLLFSQQIVRGTELLFDSRITIACVDMAKGRPVALPVDLRRHLDTFFKPEALSSNR